MRDNLTAGLIVAGGLLLGVTFGNYLSSRVRSDQYQACSAETTRAAQVQSARIESAFQAIVIEYTKQREDWEFQGKLAQMDDLIARADERSLQLQKLNLRAQQSVKKSEARLRRLEQSPICNPLFEFAVRAPTALYGNDSKVFGSMMQDFSRYQDTLGGQDAKN